MGQRLTVLMPFAIILAGEERDTTGNDREYSPCPPISLTRVLFLDSWH